MSKANEPAYPVRHVFYSPGLTKKEKLAMEIYARLVIEKDYGASADRKKELADYSLRAADIFFEQLESFNQNKVK